MDRELPDLWSGVPRRLCCLRLCAGKTQSDATQEPSPPLQDSTACQTIPSGRESEAVGRMFERARVECLSGKTENSALTMLNAEL